MINHVRQQVLKWRKTRRAVVLMVSVCVLGVGISLAASEHWQTETPARGALDVDRTLVDGTRGALPVRRDVAPPSSLPAYQIAIANAEGVRLKTIVTR